MTASALDACLCLLLVSAAAVTVASVPDAPREQDRADAVAESLAATAAFEYTLAPGAVRADESLISFERTRGPEFRRYARGSLSALLARAAVRTVRVDGKPVTHAGVDFARKARDETRTSLPGRAQVVVRWRPYPGAHLGREFAVGPSPPRDADVNAATVRVPGSVSNPADAERVARHDGFDGLATAVATSLVDGLLPPDQTRLALAGDAPVSTLMRYRYRRFAALYGVDVADLLAHGDTRATNDRLAAAMADHVESDLRASFDSPSQAADHIALGRVDVVVRTWSA